MRGHVDKAGVALIHGFERCVLSVYLDQGCLSTVGWGHLITFAECEAFGVDRAKAQAAAAAFRKAAQAKDKAGMRAAIALGKEAIANAPPITRAKADELFERDLLVIETDMWRLLRVPLVQHQGNALTSFTYNVGARTLRASTLLKRLNGGGYDEVPAQLLRFRFANGVASNGLLNRRKAEAAVWEGDAASIPAPAVSKPEVVTAATSPSSVAASPPILPETKQSASGVGWLMGRFVDWLISFQTVKGV